MCNIERAVASAGLQSYIAIFATYIHSAAKTNVIAIVPPEYETFWSLGERLHPDMLHRARFLEAFAFGDSERLAAELADLVLQGVKRATASLVWSYET